VSVVIPALNEERYLGACLLSLVAQDYPAERMEVIVADGGSADRTRAIVAEVAGTAPFPVRLVDNPARTTPGGLNAGVAAAKGDVIVVLGAHAEAGERFIPASVDALRETGAAAAGGPIETVGEGTVAAAIAAALSHPFGVGDARFRFATRPGFVDTIAFAAYRRECFTELGGFDLDREKAEDDFFNFRVRQAGGRLYLTPAISSRYFARPGFRSVARQYFGYGRAKGRAAVEEPASLRPRHLAPVAALVGGALLAMLGFRWEGPRNVLLGLGALYAAGAAVGGWQATARRSRPGLAPLAGAVFPVLHASYGLGTIAGVVAAAVRRR
jgi:glycosyltransferase involved in cell wall biosynthesis